MADNPSACLSHLQAVEAVLLFFGVNICAHCLTMKEYNGQTLSMTIYRALVMLLNPVTSGGQTMTSLYRFLRNYRAPVGAQEILRSFFEDLWPLQTAIAAGAVAVEISEDRQADAIAEGWERVVSLDSDEPVGCIPIILRSDGQLFAGENSPKVLDLFYVPISVQTTRDIHISPATSWTRTVVAVAQLAYSTFTLFGSHRAALKQQGLSSPYVLVVPYIFMSLLNLIANLLEPTYTHVTVLTELPTRFGDFLERDNTFSEWIDRLYGLQQTSSTPTRRGADSVLDRISVATSHTKREKVVQFVRYSICLVLITVVLLPITSSRSTNTAATASYLVWLYIPYIIDVADFSSLGRGGENPYTTIWDFGRSIRGRRVRREDVLEIVGRENFLRVYKHTKLARDVWFVPILLGLSVNAVVRASRAIYDMDTTCS